MTVGTTKEHLGFALALGVPTFVVVSKIDACRAAQTERTLQQLERTLKGPGCRRVPLRVDTEDDACTAASNFHSERSNLLSCFFCYRYVDRNKYKVMNTCVLEKVN